MSKYESTNLPKGKVFDLLSSEHRRTVAEILLHEGGQWTADSLAREVFVRENNTSSVISEEEKYERILITLLHCDLPKLADADVLRFDGQTVTPSVNLDDFASLV